MWNVRIERRALKDIAAIDRADQRRILDFLERRLATRDNPRELGEALTGPLAGHWKYRVGPYRIIAGIDDSEIVIRVIRVGNRRDVYR